MDFREVLKSGCFCLELRGKDKQELIIEMVDLLVSAGKIDNREAALEAVLERERSMSTGMQGGIALPHGKTDAVDGLVTAFALKKEGLDFESLDGQPARIFIMTISPKRVTGPHVKYLAAIGRVLNSASVRERLLGCSSADELIAVLCE